jgi:hypothetical protein
MKPGEALQWLLLLLAFGGVLRPNSTCGHRRQLWRPIGGEWTGNWYPDGVDGTSSVRGPSFPVCLLLAHFGCTEWNSHRASRRRLGRRARTNLYVFRPALHLLAHHRMPTTIPPLVHLSAALCQQNKAPTQMVFVFIGAGLYFLILLLKNSHIERNPGPLSESDKQWFSSVLAERLRPIEADISEIKTKQIEISQRIESTEKKVAANSKDVQNLIRSNITMSKRVSQLERDSRRKNIVLFGVNDEVDDRDAFKQLVTEQLGLPEAPSADAIFRLGQKKGNRPILVKLNSEEDKRSVMSKVGALKGTKLRISDDLTPEDQAARRTIIAAANAAKEFGLLSKVRRNGLLIDNCLYEPQLLMDPDWLSRHRWFVRKEGGPPPAGVTPLPGGKRPRQNDPPLGGSQHFLRPRSGSSSSVNSNAGN